MKGVNVIITLTISIISFMGICFAADDGDFQYWNNESISWRLDENWKAGFEEELRLGDRITLLFDGSFAVPLLQDLAGIYDIQTDDTSCRITVDDHRKRLPQILDFFVHKGSLIKYLSIQEADLEDVFITLAR